MIASYRASRVPFEQRSSAALLPLPVGSIAGGSAGRLLRDNGTVASWSTFTSPDTYGSGSIPYASSANVLAALAIGGADTVLTSSGSAPQWSSSLALAGTLRVTGGIGQNTSPGTVIGFHQMPNLSGATSQIGAQFNARCSTEVTASFNVVSVLGQVTSLTPLTNLRCLNVAQPTLNGTTPAVLVGLNIATLSGGTTTDAIIVGANRALFGGTVEIDGALDHDGTTAAVFGVAQATRAAAMTQTYSTADRTHAARTAAALTDSIAGTVGTTLAAVPDPADAPATADALRDDLVANVLPAIRNALSSLADQVNKGRVDCQDSAQFLNAWVDSEQTYGWAQ